MHLAFAALLTSILSINTLHAETYQIDSEPSQVAFNVRHLVSQAHGLFNEFSGQIEFDPEHPEKTQVEATIVVSSIDTDNEKRDAHLRSSDFFDVESFPSMTFKSTGAAVKDGVIQVAGDFSMHGVTRSIVLPVTVLGTGTNPWSKKAQIGMAAKAVLGRSEYGVNTWTDAAGILGDDVEINLMVQANAQ
ncbi:MAG: YceI family protein [Candidatus Latescibacterota bacterium]